MKTKTTVTMSLDKHIFAKFKAMCKQKGYTVSGKIEALISEEIA